jgi:hypothetical protein
MLFIGVVISIEAWPVYKIFSVQTLGRHIGLSGWVFIALLIIVLLILNICALFLPMKTGLGRLEQREI